MIDIITESDEWNASIKLADHSDFYHTYFYHNLSRKDNETPVLIKYTDKNYCILLPLLVRQIKDSDYKDATSVYGYSGLLCSTKLSNIDNTNFKEELNQYFLNQKIVSVFSRLHPYLDHQEDFLEQLGHITNPGDVVYIDLLESLDEQRRNYSSRLKTHVNKADRLCSIIKGDTKEHMQAFIDIYYENMKRVNANESYFFDEDYFYQLMSSTDFDTELSLAIDNETQEIIAGALFIKTDEIVQYHLSGIKEAFLDLNPIKLVIDKMRIKATSQGYKYLNLGGGRSNKQDSLFSFKSSFSKNFKAFKLWKYIANQDIYDDLVKRQEAMEVAVDFEIDKDFFPAYRRTLIYDNTESGQ